MKVAKVLGITPQMQESAVQSTYVYILVISVVLLLLSAIELIKIIRGKDTKDYMSILRALSYIVVIFIIAKFDYIVGTLFMLKVSAICDMYTLVSIALRLPYIVIILNVVNIFAFILKKQKYNKD